MVSVQGRPSRLSSGNLVLPSTAALLSAGLTSRHLNTFTVTNTPLHTVTSGLSEHCYNHQTCQIMQDNPDGAFMIFWSQSKEHQNC